MGVVYRAHDENLDTDCVIKVPNSNVLNLPGFAERFVREIRSLVKLSHPHIVKISDVGQNGEVPFAVMQYLSGGDLDDRRGKDNSRRPLPVEPRTLINWLPSIAEALDFVHRQGFIHRDVKPANILFDSHGNAYLSDFGLVKVVAESAGQVDRNLTSSGILLGTPGFAAPEMALGQPFDGRADQYSLAVTIYELLSGCRAFSGSSPAAIIVAQSTKQPPELSSLDKSIPQRLSSAVRQAMSKEPDQRFGECQQLSREVLAALGGETVQQEGQTAAIPVTGSESTSDTTGGSDRKTLFEHRLETSADQSDVQTQPVVMPAHPNPQEKGRRGTYLATLLFVAGFVLAAFYYLKQHWFEDLNDELEPTAAFLEEADGEAEMPSPISVEEQVVDRAPNDARPQAVEQDHTTNIRLPRLVATLEGHAEAILSVAYNQSGDLLATGGNNLIKIWHVNSQIEHATFRGHEQAVSAVSFLPRGGKLVSGSWDGTIKLWDVASGEELQTKAEDQEAVGCLSISPDGSRLVSCGWDGFIRRWIISDGEIHDSDFVYVGHDDRVPVTSVAFSRQGELLVSGGEDQTVIVWDVATGELRFRLTGHAGVVHSVAFSPEGTVAASGGEDATVRLWDLDLHKELVALMDHQGPVQAVAFSPDGHALASAGDDATIKLWDVETRTLLKSWIAHSASIRAIAFAPDGGTLASASLDKTIKLWSIKGD